MCTLLCAFVYVEEVDYVRPVLGTRTHTDNLGPLRRYHDRWAVRQSWLHASLEVRVSSRIWWMKVNSLKRKDCNFLATRSFAGHEANWPLLLHKLSLSTENQAKSSFFRFSSLSLWWSRFPNIILRTELFLHSWRNKAVKAFVFFSADLSIMKRGAGERKSGVFAGTT